MFGKLLNPVISSSCSRLAIKTSPARSFVQYHQHQQPHDATHNRRQPTAATASLFAHGHLVMTVRGFRSTTEGSAAKRVTSSAVASDSPAGREDTVSGGAGDGDDRIVPVSLAHIRKTIRSGGVDLADGYCCLRTVCPACMSDAPLAAKSAASAKAADTVRPTSVYINKTTGTVVCPTCQIVRSWSAMESCFQRPANGSAKASRDFEAVRQQFVKTKETLAECRPDQRAVPIGQLSTAVAAEVLRHLRLETFSVALLDSFGALCSPDEQCLHFPLHDVNGRTVGYKVIERRDVGGADGADGDTELVERTVPESNCFGVLCSEPKSQRDAANAVVVLNVVDLLALAAQKLSSAIVCLPHGFKSLPQQCLPALERFSRLTLWFHNDTVSWDTARTFAKKLDERRCVFVRPTEAHPAPFAAHTDGLDMRQVLASAQPVLHKAITTFAALRQDVLSDIQNIDKVQGVKWRRFPVLNKLLKGHRKGELTVLTGPTGCGKTTFMSEYSLDLTMQGVTTLWGSFEIRNTRLASTLLRQLAGHPFDERLAEFDRWANEFERLPMYFMTFHGQQSIKVVMETIEHAQYVHDIQHVIIDNVQFMMGTTDEPKHVDRFWRQDAIIGAFRTFATKKNCHVTLVIHPRKERDVDDLTTSSIFGGAKATQEADNVLIIQDKRLTAIRGKKYLQIAKNRYSGDLGIMPMDFDKVALSYAAKRSPAIAKKPEEAASTMAAEASLSSLLPE